MCSFDLQHLADATLLRDLASLIARDQEITALVIAHITEVDARRLYAPAGYPSMFAYCVGELWLSEDAAYKRIQAARTARRFPVLFEALAKGRLHLSGVCLMAAHLTHENVQNLVEAASGKRKAEIEELIAQHFPRPDVPTVVLAIPAPAGACDERPAGSGAGKESGDLLESSPQERPESPAPMTQSARLAPGQVGTTQPPSRAFHKVTPIAPQRFALQVTIPRHTRDKLEHAKALLSHAIPTGDLADVLDHILDLAIERLEQRKFAATHRPRTTAASTGARRTNLRVQDANTERNSARNIPSDVKRAVWRRDGGRCTFVSETGRRCTSRTRLELDHVDPVARGGTATIGGIRLRCRTHNQYEAERAFGAAFMEARRRRSRVSA